jgi:AAA family ATP:ADP antiporter
MSAVSQSTRNDAMAGRSPDRPRHARFLELIAPIQPGEGRCFLLFFSYAFVLLVAYYLVRTLREPLLLVDGSPAVKTYASAAAALALLLLVPLYGGVFRRIDKNRMVRWVTGFFITTLGALHVATRAGFDVGFVYYVWVGIFGVGIVAQFWAHAADCFDATSGRRLFPAIMMGATLGGLVGPLLFRALHGALVPAQLMLVAMALLALTLPLADWTRRSVPARSRAAGIGVEPIVARPLGGFSLILRDRYLLLVATLVVLLNCVNTMGEYLLADVVVRHAEEQVALYPWLDKGDLIGEFYANFILTVNGVTVFAQVFLVGRVFRWVGIGGAVLVLPVIALVGYGLVAFLPLLVLLQAVKVLENGADYSVMNTARQALFLPLSVAGKYEGKIATDTFFWRFGDLFPAAIVFVGLNWLHLDARQFAVVNIVLCLAWIAVATQLAKREAAGSLAGALARLAERLVAVGRFALAPRRLELAARASGWLAAGVGVLVLGVAAPADAAGGGGDRGERGLFEEEQPLAAEITLDFKALCRDPQRATCADLPATLAYHDALGHEQRVAVALRTRGRYRTDTVQCDLPALFVFFTSDTRGTPFDGESMLPLTTHCERAAEYEQYVLKEYLAYRIYNLLTSKSLRVRLVRVTYRDANGRVEPFARYAFFTEHFASFARRQHVTVHTARPFDPLTADPLEIATLDLFEYAIGNTDWSVVYGHNVLLVEGEAGLVTPVPFDFDFSGLVNAEYASVSPQLAITSVRERVFRGVCRAETDWDAAFAHFASRRDDVLALATQIEGLEPKPQADVSDYLEGAFETFASAQRRDRRIVGACRPADGGAVKHESTTRLRASTLRR